jgi:glucosamine--fructose-6-phosphate aminotransferase (isomerizing)
MCGIIGYLGPQEAMPIILDGLKRLEYRGYDSAGMAVVTEHGLNIRRSLGKLVELEKLLLRDPLPGQVGIGHTRWATHGRPSETNAHPHMVGDIAVVHNGIIENYLELKEELIKAGHRFASETDTNRLPPHRQAPGRGGALFGGGAADAQGNQGVIRPGHHQRP